jgi:hypothetical protein
MSNTKNKTLGEDHAFAMVDSHANYIQNGLTIREHFAAMAMQGLLTRVPQRHNGEVDLGVIESTRIVEEAVIMADKLIAELNKEQP